MRQARGAGAAHRHGGPTISAEPAPPPSQPAVGGAQPAGGRRNLPVAIATGLVLAGLLLGTLFWSALAFLILACTVLLVAQHELYAALRERGASPAAFLGYGAALVLLVGAHLRGPEAVAFGLTLTVIATFVWYLAEPPREGLSTDVAATLLGIVYVPLLASHVLLMRGLPDGAILTVAAIGAAVFYDVGAYASGSVFGRRRMAPRISPNKTWEGAAGATIVTFAGALAVGPFLGPLNLASSALLAATVALVAPLGDLTESLIKRDLAVKDLGSLLPGHGGALDRIDSLLFAVPAAYWLFRAVL